MKREEVKLALEVSDMIDELHSINRLFEVQADVLQLAAKVIYNIAENSGKSTDRWRDPYRNLHNRFKKILEQDIPGYQIQVKRMMADAQRTKDSVCSSSKSYAAPTHTHIRTPKNPLNTYNPTD